MAETTKKVAAETVSHTLGSLLRSGLDEIARHGVEKVKSALDDLAKDMLSAKGSIDDAAASLILKAYRKKADNSENFKSLHRMLGFLTYPEQVGFYIASIAHMALTSKKTEDETATKPVHEHAKLELLGVNFTDDDAYTSLFEVYDTLMDDFRNLESQGNANHKSVVELIKSTRLYGDQTLAKRLSVGLLLLKDRDKAVAWFKQHFSKLGEALKPIVEKAEIKMKDWETKTANWATNLKKPRRR